ncbi:metalloregulator ArsR/SmtB family transcription factor [Cumulibacter soli]|uniref:metalloregulator ArsR/SmtB family transcription factor n=1 Tax=Cumulibacter soli TaxID=2546344 RepID=UPI00141968C9|nr:metalloregulator ArsR/SmtB family transcription factor [Cumulibacter soli]
MTQPVRTAAQAGQDAIVFKALANAVRLQIVSLVAAAPQGQVSAGEIVDQFDLSQPTISHHLRVLREAGVLTTHKSSTFVYYRFAPRLHEAVTSVLPNHAAVAPPSEARPTAGAHAVASSASVAGTAAAEPSEAAQEASAHAGQADDEDVDTKVAIAEPDEASAVEDSASSKPKSKKSKKDKKSKKGKKR